MIEFMRALLDHGDAFRWIFMLAMLLVFYRWMQSENGIEWRDFVSAEKPDGTYRGDINRVGQCVGVVVSAFAIVATAPKAHTDFAGFSLVLAACLAFLGGVAAYAATLRSKSGRVETTTTVEPAPAPSGPVKTTVKTTEPAAAAPTVDEPLPVKVVQEPGEAPIKVKDEGKP